MEEDQIYENVDALIDRLKRLQLITTGLEDQLDDLSELSNTKYQFQNDFAIFNENRNDSRIIENMRSDLEIKAYVGDLEKTIELVRETYFERSSDFNHKSHFQIMQKYREHTQHQIAETKLNFENVVGHASECKCASEIQKKSQQIDQLVKMYRETVSDHSIEFNKLLEENSKLRTENQTLRKIIEASNDVKETQSVGCEWSFQKSDSDDDSDDLDTSQETVKSPNSTSNVN